MHQRLTSRLITDRKGRVVICAAALGLVMMSGCSSSDEASPPATDSNESTTTSRSVAPTTETTAGSEETATTSTPPGAGTEVDIGGLTVVVAPDAIVPDPESGVTLTPGSVYRLPGESFEELEAVDVTNRVVTTVDGEPVIIYLFGSDTLFDVGSSTVKSTAEAALPAVVASMDQRSPSGRILVRGFTDSTGSAAGNQTLSEQRAQAVTDWLTSNGVASDRVETSGFGSSVPAAEESSDEGAALNRRIEIVVIG